MPFASASLLIIIFVLCLFAKLGGEHSVFRKHNILLTYCLVALSLTYPFLFFGTLFALSFLYILDRGVEYVNWPKLLPPTDIIQYDGPGFRTGPHGRGKGLSKLPIPLSLRRLWMNGRRKASIPHKLEEIEMGNGSSASRLTSRKRFE
jgi:hypothetical protein